MAGNQGLGSSNMDEKTKHKIQSAGGKASQSGSNTTSRSSSSTDHPRGFDDRGVASRAGKKGGAK